MKAPARSTLPTSPTGSSSCTRRVDRLEAELIAAREQHGPVPIDTILAISAAVAAYLGKKATVRQIHYSHSDTWARLGRSAVHASHTFSRRMG